MQIPMVSEGYLPSIKPKSFTVTDMISSKSTSGLKVHFILKFSPVQNSNVFHLNICVKQKHD